MQAISNIQVFLQELLYIELQEIFHYSLRGKTQNFQTLKQGVFPFKGLMHKIRGAYDQVCRRFTWGVQALKYPNFFSGMEADRNVKVVGGDVAVL